MEEKIYKDELEQEIENENCGTNETNLGEAPKMYVNNNTSLRNDLLDVYNQMRLGKIGLRQAKEVANVAGKVVSSAKAQLDYNVTIGRPDNKIDFFEQ